MEYGLCALDGARSIEKLIQGPYWTCLGNERKEVRDGKRTGDMTELNTCNDDRE